MTQIEASTDRDEIVKIISDFYNFLSTFPYLPSSSIRAPPHEGWPEDIRETFRKMGKTDQVVDLLSHLPYIDTTAWEVFPETEPIDYISSRSLKRIDRAVSLDPVHQKIPDHVVSLTCGRNYGIWLLLDMQTGTVTEYSLLNGPQPSFTDAEFQSGNTWRLYPTKPLGEFFTTLKEKYRALQAIPMVRNDGDSGVIWVGGGKRDVELEEIRKIYRDHGWPTADFRKEDCKTELQAWYKEWLDKAAKQMK